MESSHCHGRPILSKFLHMFVLISCMSAGLAFIDFGSETDRLALLNLKKRITKDTFRIISSWNDSVDFCSWIGLTCQYSTKRVMILDLEAQELVGSLPHSIGNLTYLTGINLRHNHFHISPSIENISSLLVCWLSLHSILKSQWNICLGIIFSLVSYNAYMTINSTA